MAKQQIKTENTRQFLWFSVRSTVSFSLVISAASILLPLAPVYADVLELEEVAQDFVDESGVTDVAEDSETIVTEPVATADISANTILIDDSEVTENIPESEESTYMQVENDTVLFGEPVSLEVATNTTATSTEIEEESFNAEDIIRNEISTTQTAVQIMATTTPGARDGASASSSSTTSTSSVMGWQEEQYNLGSSSVIDTETVSTSTGTAVEEVVENEKEVVVTEENTHFDTLSEDSADTVISEQQGESVTNEQNVSAGTSTAATTTLSYDVPEPIVPSVVVNNSNRYQFADTECLSVGDGSFYCSKSDEGTPVERQDGIYALPDADGDTEIFLVKDGLEYKVTDNTEDDLAPTYDQISSRIVWQRLINDRYQIISKELGVDDEVVLTNNSFNSMEPVAYGDITVWQSWIENNWEIMLYEKGSTTALTSNDVHDIAPFINKDYIIWQTQEEDGWYMTLYDRETKIIERIANDTGTAIENPRLVLVYDARYNNGDVQTLGYNFDTKEIVPLAAVPVPLPEHIPEPDQTGEERALLQTKPTTEEDVVVEDAGTSGAGTPPLNPDLESDTETATSTGSLTLEVPPFDAEMVSEPIATTTNEIPTSNEDVVINTRGTTTDHIADLIVTPLDDAQIESASSTEGL